MKELKKTKENTKVTSNQSPKTNYLLIFGIICLITFLGVLIYPLIIGHFFHSSLERGLAGDMYGVLNTLFSGLAFAGIIITIIMQMKELELTRDELQKSAEAQQGTYSALTQQLENMKYSSQIDAIKKYIESLDIHSDEDKIIIAKSVLSDLVDSIFHSAEYISYMGPKISNAKLEPFVVDINPNRTTNSVKLRLKNSGASCFIKNINASNGITYKVFTSKFHEILQRDIVNFINEPNPIFERNGTLVVELFFAKENEVLELFTIEFEFVSKFVNYTWKQKLIVQHFKHNQGSIIFEDMVLVN